MSTSPDSSNQSASQQRTGHVEKDTPLRSPNMTTQRALHELQAGQGQKFASVEELMKSLASD